MKREGACRWVSARHPHVLRFTFHVLYYCFVRYKSKLKDADAWLIEKDVTSRPFSSYLTAKQARLRFQVFPMFYFVQVLAQVPGQQSPVIRVLFQ